MQTNTSASASTPKAQPTAILNFAALLLGIIYTNGIKLFSNVVLGSNSLTLKKEFTGKLYVMPNTTAYASVTITVNFAVGNFAIASNSANLLNVAQNVASVTQMFTSAGFTQITISAMLAQNSASVQAYNVANGIGTVNPTIASLQAQIASLQAQLQAPTTAK